MKKRLLVLLVALATMVGLSACGGESKQTSGKDDKKYTNINFDYTEEIASYDAKNTDHTTPEDINIGISVADEKGATGVELVTSLDTSNTTDYYLNTLVAGNKLIFKGADIKICFKSNWK